MRLVTPDEIRAYRPVFLGTTYVQESTPRPTTRLLTGKAVGIPYGNGTPVIKDAILIPVLFT